MQTNVHLSIYRPFPHPSCLVQHLQFVNYKLNVAQTHLRVDHTINHYHNHNHNHNHLNHHSIASSPHKIILHKSLDGNGNGLGNSVGKQQVRQEWKPTEIINTSVGEMKRVDNALTVKNKIEIKREGSGSASVKLEGIKSRIGEKERVRWLDSSKERLIKRKEQENRAFRQDVQKQKTKRKREIDEDIYRQPNSNIEIHKIKTTNPSFPSSVVASITSQPSLKNQSHPNPLSASFQSDLLLQSQSSQISHLKSQISKLNTLLIRIRKQHASELQHLTQQLQRYQAEVENLRESRINSQTTNLKNKQLNTTLFQELEELRTILRNEKEKTNGQRKEIHQFKKKVFELESVNIDNIHEIEELKEIVSMKHGIISQYQHKNQELVQCLHHSLAELQQIKSDVDTKRSNTKELHSDMMDICEVLLNVGNTLQKVKSFELPNSLLKVKSEIWGMKQKIANSYQQIQAMHRGQITVRCKYNRKNIVMLSDKEVESVNDSYKYLKTCADQDTIQPGDNSLYQMILCQATVLEEKL